MSRAPNKKLVRVELTHEDGLTLYLEGDEAEAWLNEVNGCIMNAYAHGFKMKEHQWKGFEDVEDTKEG